MDGFPDPATSASKLIALSGYAAPEDVARAKEAGFDLHIAKPATLDHFFRACARQPTLGCSRMIGS